MKKFAIIALTLACASAIAAEEDVSGNPVMTYPNALGMYLAFAPNFSQAGDPVAALTYQRWIGRIGASVAAGYVRYAPDYYSGLAIGEVTLNLYGSAFTGWFAGQLYLFASAGYFGYAIPATSIPYSAPVSGFEAGLGLGIEPVLFKQYSLPVEAGYYIRIPFNIGFAVRIGPRIRF